MDVFEAIKKRTAIRNFTAQPVPDDLLQRIIVAAHKAPTGGNTPHRRIMALTDPKLIHALKQFAPGILGEPTAILVFYTDLNVILAEREKITNSTSPIDAGAAAENAALAATALGLGSCFTKSYSEAAVKVLLGLPDGFRTEVMLQLGYPEQNRPNPVKPRKNGRITEINKFGRMWN